MNAGAVDVRTQLEEHLPDSIVAERVPWLWVVGGVGASTLLRLRTLSTPLTPDEGGFLAVARAWSNGATLYRDVWVDRPQGLLVLFRIWDALSGGSNASVRVMAMLFAALLIVSTAAAVTVIAGRSAGALAAILVAVTCSSPAIEGHIANGELLSGAVGMAGLATGCRAIRIRSRPGLYVWSGVFAGLALSIKQSGYDGLAALVLWLIVAAVTQRIPRGEVRRAVALLAAGTASIVALLVAHGAISGMSRWWFAVAGYRLSGRSALAGANWGRLRETAAAAAPILGPLAATVAIAGGIALVRGGRGHRPRSSGDILSPLLWTWPLASSAAFLTGGQFHRHYWVMLCPAMAALAAVALAHMKPPRLAVILTVVVLMPALYDSIELLRLDPLSFTAAASRDARAGPNAAVASWFEQHRRPGDALYIMCASAAFYAAAHEDPPFPYLWLDGVQTVPGAAAELRALLESDANAPTYIAIYQSPHECDPSGALSRVVEERYRLFAAVAGGVRILARHDREAFLGP